MVPVLAVALAIQLAAKAPAKAAEDGQGIWDPAVHIGGKNEP